MQNLYTISVTGQSHERDLSEGERLSVLYHDLFDFPLNFSEMIKWSPHRSFGDYAGQATSIVHKNGFYFVGGKEGIVYKRMLRKRISAKKLEIAKKASKVLSALASVKMVAVTGSLAMQNSTDESDIDLMIVTKSGSLWMTRLLVYMVIHAFGLSARKPNDWRQKDKLCLNMWLDESDLVWGKKDRNLYTAHEVAQIVPLVNKDETYEKLLSKNIWVLDFWPNSVKISKLRNKMENRKSENRKFTPGFFEKFCYWLQYRHMKSKITREIVTPTRALFHPQDWGKVVLGRLSS